MAHRRDLSWEGCLNVRDLGEMTTVSGGKTRSRAVVRGDHPGYLTVAGWSALWAYGIRTVVSLETANLPAEIAQQANRPINVDQFHDGLSHVRVGIEDAADAQFMRKWADNGLWCTPLYYHDALARWPDRHAQAIAAVAHAAPGGVLLHCGRGCDRTGIIALLLLALAGVAEDEIVEDYARSTSRLQAREPEYPSQLAATLATHGTSVPTILRELIASLDVVDYLRRGGLRESDIAAARRRLVNERES